MYRLFVRCSLIGIPCLAFSGCPADDADESAGGSTSMGGSTATTSSSTTSSTSSGSASSTTAIDDPEAFCAQFASREDCGFTDEAQGVYCSWYEITPVTLDQNACVLGTPVGSCYAASGNTTDPGCAPPPGCDGQPHYLELDGQIGVFSLCGGSGPTDGQPCTYVEPGVFDPPECGCICDALTGTSSGGGEGTASSGTG